MPPALAPHLFAWASTLGPECFLSRKEAAVFLQILGVPIQGKTLANLAANGNALGGPPYIRLTWKAVRYRVSDLQAWAGSRKTHVGAVAARTMNPA